MATSFLGFATLLVGPGCDDPTSNEASLGLEIDDSKQGVTVDEVAATGPEDSEFGSEPGQGEYDQSVPLGAGAIASIDLPGDHTIWFYADESGAGMTEFSSNGINYMSSDEFFKATPAEMFWAFSAPGTEIPEALLNHHHGRELSGKALSWAEITTQPQGWGQQDLAPYPAAFAVECDNFATNHCPYSTGTCSVDLLGGTSWSNTDELDEYYGAVCVDNGTVTDALKYKRQLPAAACEAESNWTTLWNASFSAGDLATHSWTTGDPSPYGLRIYDHNLTNGLFDTWNWSHRYIEGNCVG